MLDANGQWFPDPPTDAAERTAWECDYYTRLYGSGSRSILDMIDEPIPKPPTLWERFKLWWNDPGDSLIDMESVGIHMKDRNGGRYMDIPRVITHTQLLSGDVRIGDLVPIGGTWPYLPGDSTRLVGGFNSIVWEFEGTLFHRIVK